MKSVKIKVLSTIITCCVMICVILGGVFLTKGFKSLIEAAIEGGITGGITQDKIDEGTSGGDGGGSVTTSGYDFASGAITSTSNYNYTSNTNFFISSYSELKNFESSVNSGVDFSGKIVYLTENIDCGGNGIGIGDDDSWFRGTFNGNGKIISNYSPNNYVASTTNFLTNNLAYGLFPQISTTTKIINLKILNSGRSISGGDYKYIGGIVGNSEGGTIENCIVENFTISTTDKTDRIYVSGIFGAGYATVKNCYVEGLTINNGCGASAGIGCAANKNFMSFGTVYYAWENENSKITSSVVVYGSSFSNPIILTEKYNHTIEDCYSSKDSSYSSLGCSAIGGKNPSDNTAWYFYSQYNDGWPMLRLFMDWQTLNFNAINGTVDKETVQIPAEITTTFSSSRSTIDIYGQIVASNGIAPYTIPQPWTYNKDTKKYTIEYIQKYINLTFERISVSSGNYYPGDGATEVTVKVYDFETIEVNCEHTATATTITIKIGSRETITYNVVHTQYTIDSYGSFWYQPSGMGRSEYKLEEIPSKFSHFTHNESFNIIPKLKLKEYTPDFPV